MYDSTTHLVKPSVQKKSKLQLANTKINFISLFIKPEMEFKEFEPRFKSAKIRQNQV